MANEGGYVQPTNPAPVSGPGALSQRTDGGAVDGMTQPAQSYTGGAYGENKSTMDQQTASPLAGDPFSMPSLMDINPSNKPMTHGINIGEGPGTEAIRNQPNTVPNIIDTLRVIAQNDPSGDTELIYRGILDSNGLQ